MDALQAARVADDGKLADLDLNVLDGLARLVGNVNLDLDRLAVFKHLRDRRGGVSAPRLCVCVQRQSCPALALAQLLLGVAPTSLCSLAEMVTAPALTKPKRLAFSLSGGRTVMCALGAYDSLRMLKLMELLGGEGTGSR